MLYIAVLSISSFALDLHPCSLKEKNNNKNNTFYGQNKAMSQIFGTYMTLASDNRTDRHTVFFLFIYMKAIKNSSTIFRTFCGRRPAAAPCPYDVINRGPSAANHPSSCSANQNVSNNIPTEKHEEWPPRAG